MRRERALLSLPSLQRGVLPSQQDCRVPESNSGTAAGGEGKKKSRWRGASRGDYQTACWEPYTTTRIYPSFQSYHQQQWAGRGVWAPRKELQESNWEKRGLSRALICSCGGRQGPPAALTQPMVLQDAQHPWPSLAQFRQGCCTRPGSLYANRHRQVWASSCSAFLKPALLAAEKESLVSLWACQD